MQLSGPLFAQSLDFMIQITRVVPGSAKLPIAGNEDTNEARKVVFAGVSWRSAVGEPHDFSVSEQCFVVHFDFTAIVDTEGDRPPIYEADPSVHIVDIAVLPWEQRAIIEKVIVAQKKQLAELEKAKGVFETAAQQAQAALGTAQKSFNSDRDKLVEQRLKVQAVIRRAREAKLDGEEADKLEKSVVDLDKDIRQSRELQAEAREKQKKALSEFSDTFDRVAKAILGLEVSASIHFDGRQVETKMSERGDLTSAAIETLKILTFDLAALISSVEGRGFHPRFLIHDGPRICASQTQDQTFDGLAVSVFGHCAVSGE